MPAPVVTRFAPAPTGFLHIGNARTALFNWLYARHCGGKFLLRIEDTDRARSTREAIDAIFEGLAWLGIDHDGEAMFQFARRDRHAEIAGQMLDQGHVYRCYMNPEELGAERELAHKEGRTIRSPWRDREPADYPANTGYVVRIKAPDSGEIAIDDVIQGRVVIPANDLDDMVLLRVDGTPTYMLSVVVDDHDMGITHIVRGDDHLKNAARQTLVYHAMGWNSPAFAHMGLIHGPDGAKLSKRHGALGVDAYRDMGYLPAAMRNYLARLGWSHGDDEIFSDAQAIDWFELADINKASSRIDFTKLESVNAQHIRNMDHQALIEEMIAFRPDHPAVPFSPKRMEIVHTLMDAVTERAKTLNDLWDGVDFALINGMPEMTEGARTVLTDEVRGNLTALIDVLNGVAEWTEEEIGNAVKAELKERGIKLGQVGPGLRTALTGRTTSPSIFLVLQVLGKSAVLARMEHVLRAKS